MLTLLLDKSSGKARRIREEEGEKPASRAGRGGNETGSGIFFPGPHRSGAYLSDEECERRFRVSRLTYEHIRAACLEWRDLYFVQNLDAVGSGVHR
jgi:hypothetical protein